MTFLSVVLRTFISFLFLLILVRIVGKQQLSQLTFFDFISGITIGSLAAIAASDLTVAWEPLLAIFVWIMLTLAAANLALYSRKAKKIIDGEPAILIRKGKVLEHNLGKVRYTMDDLRSQLRIKGAYSIADVEYAILETNGDISVMKNPRQEPPVRQDFLLAGEYKGIETELVVDGEIIYENLKTMNKDEKWLREMLRAYGVEFSSEVFYCSVDEKGKFYVDKYDDALQKDAIADISDYKIDEYVNSDIPSDKKHVAEQSIKGLSSRLTDFENNQVSKEYPHAEKVEQQVREEQKTAQEARENSERGKHKT